MGFEFALEECFSREYPFRKYYTQMFGILENTAAGAPNDTTIQVQAG